MNLNPESTTDQDQSYKCEYGNNNFYTIQNPNLITELGWTGIESGLCFCVRFDQLLKQVNAGGFQTQDMALGILENGETAKAGNVWTETALTGYINRTIEQANRDLDCSNCPLLGILKNCKEAVLDQMEKSERLISWKQEMEHREKQAREKQKAIEDEWAKLMKDVKED
jgi:hypothetical protein